MPVLAVPEGAHHKGSAHLHRTNRNESEQGGAGHLF